MRWLKAVEAVAELTRVSWNEVYEYPILDTLTYIRYHNIKMEKKKREIDEFRRKIKH